MSMIINPFRFAAGGGGASRRWRVATFANTTGGEVAASSFGEIEFRATAGGADQATGGTAITNSTGSGSAVSNAFDNNNATFWLSANTTSEYGTYWAGYDWGAGNSVSVEQVAVRQRPDTFGLSEAITHGAVEYSDDGTTWNYKFPIYTVPWTSTTSELRAFSDPRIPGVPWVASVGAMSIDVTTSISVPYPPRIASGDLLVLHVSHRSTLTTPSGWTKQAESAALSVVPQKTAVFTKVADGSESGSLTITQSSSDNLLGQMMLVKGSRGTISATSGTKAAEATNDGVATHSLSSIAKDALVIPAMGFIFALAGGAPVTITVESPFFLASPGFRGNSRFAIAHAQRSAGYSSSGIVFTNNTNANSETATTILVIEKP